MMIVQFRTMLNGVHGITYTLDNPTCRTLYDIYALKWWKMKGSDKHFNVTNIAEFWVVGNDETL